MTTAWIAGAFSIRNAIFNVVASCVWPDYCWQSIGHHLVPTAPVHTECHVPLAAVFAYMYTHVDQRAVRLAFQGIARLEH
jgi:hypothetical protein